MPVTLAAIARACDVSTATVSLALRDHPRIPAATKARIKATAKRLGYEPNRSMSRVMSEIRSGGQAPAFKETLGYFTADSPRPHAYESKLYAGIAARAKEMGYGLDRFELGQNGLSMEQLGKVLASRGIRGLILGPWPQAHAEIQLDWKGLAAVAIGYTLNRPETHRVARDVMHTLRAVFARLQAHGYKRIGFVMERGHEARMDFLTLAAFQLNAYLIPEQDRVPPLVEDNLHEASFLQWVDTHQPDVIFTMFGAVHPWLLASGRKVPEDIGLFAFNCESPQSRFSGIYPAYEAIGAAAVEQVAALVERGGFGIPDQATTLLVPGVECPGTTLRL
ncbi:LacI family DNA-binding transcriptional regulator [Coraliomargarita parva]|uniref:LacI family DNA-binding transcriptional regulator n=1 Tax=Coraliomargarita parva TaxID=3014050 RepID=UPI0022B3DB15|nr:LacI family DNA-binding transcriptional regulator [Coraliomargarita parva]